MASGRLAALCIGLFDGCVEYMASDIYAQAPKASRQVEDFDPSIVVSMHGWDVHQLLVSAAGRWGWQRRRVQLCILFHGQTSTCGLLRFPSTLTLV